MKHWIKLFVALAASAAFVATSALLRSRTARRPRTTVAIAKSRLGRILVDSKGITLYDFVTDKHGVSGLLRRLRCAVAAAHHQGKPHAAPCGVLRCSHDEAEGRKLEVTYNRTPSITSSPTESRPDDRPGRQPVRRPVVGALARGQGDPPWLARPGKPRPAEHGGSAPCELCRLNRGADRGSGAGRSLPRCPLDPASAVHAQQYYSAYFSSCLRSARSSCSVRRCRSSGRVDRPGQTVGAEHR